MDTDVAEQNAKTVVQSRPRALTKQSSSQQAIWWGPPPKGVEKVLSRDVLEPHFGPRYEWASNFALLSEEFLRGVFDAQINRIKQLERREWRRTPYMESISCKIGTTYLMVDKQKVGWTVEAFYPCVPDTHILTIEDLPVLCPTRSWAGWLAAACYPTPHANLVWRSYRWRSEGD
jgi:hypothetical protein